MAYSPVITVATGDLWSAANHNQYIRDNFAAGVPDIMTAKGDLAVATAANAASPLAIGADGSIIMAKSSESMGVAWVSYYATLGALIGDGIGVISTGWQMWLPEIPFDCTITAVRLFADAVGSVALDIWKDSYANFPPADADSIVASAPPTLSSAQKSEDTVLSGWTTTLVRGDTLGLYVDSVDTIKLLTLSLSVVRTS